MDAAQFWQLIDRTRIASGGEEKKWSELLIEELVALPVEEIMEYQRIFYRLDARAERDDLLDVADFIYGGLGDSSWSDFRAWLIGQGQATYENVLVDPETLADIVPIEAPDQITAELLIYVARIAYEKKTGEEELDIPYEPDAEPMETGESLWKGISSVEEFDRRFQEKYPRAWAKFNWQYFDES